MRDEHRRANGTTLRCRVEGPSSAQAILFSHTLAADLSMWDEQAAYFARHYRVIRYDCRGHGQSGTTAPPFSLSLLVEDVRSLLDALGVEQVHFVGLSLGGMVGQIFAARYPQRLLSLALCDTSARMDIDVWEDRIALARHDGLAKLADPTIERWFTESFREKNKARVNQARQMILATSVEGYIGASSAIRDMDNTTVLSRIATPTLVIVGRNDRSTPPSDAEVICSKIAGSSLVVIEDAAHLSNIEQAEDFNNALESFLQRQTSRALEQHS
ncbi:3-oxoadipate enol-lactonase [Dongia sp.]|uniref:3-oxoadipate enol-lactonase n=1 Tax=Dongia sp. TaxID=1977262 RepID=UPI0035AE3B6A